ncbi:restriction endonuclease [Patescibacteria group bacterium]|nr:restriction endonuclease [Patescibacteria group bacterium]
MKEIFVINLKGEKEPFSSVKVFQSAKRAGASSALAKEISKKIETLVYDGMETKEIFLKVKKFLRDKDEQAGIRFNLREAMRKLGPSGFPFEKYIGEIFSVNGFKVELNQIIIGKYVDYEIDFIAQKENLVYLGECKFRHRRGERIDMPITLAFSAKFEDIKQGNYFKKFENCEIKPIIVTNAKFSSQAKKYAKGVGIELLGWNYPDNKGLEKMIETEDLYPITIFSSLNGFLVDIFSQNKLMLAKDILKFSPEQLAKKLKINQSKVLPIIQEARILFNHNS